MGIIYNTDLSHQNKQMVEEIELTQFEQDQLIYTFWDKYKEDFEKVSRARRGMRMWGGRGRMALPASDKSAPTVVSKRAHTVKEI